MIYLQYLKTSNNLNVLVFPFSLRKQKLSFWASQKKSNVDLKLLVWRVKDWPLKLWSERLGHQWSLQNTEVMESVIISPGNYSWKKERSVVGCEHTSAGGWAWKLTGKQDRNFKVQGTSWSTYQTCTKISSRTSLSKVFCVWVVHMWSLVVSMESKSPNDKKRSILGGERKRLRCPNQKENNFNGHLLPLSFFKEKNGEKRNYIRSWKILGHRRNNLCFSEEAGVRKKESDSTSAFFVVWNCFLEKMYSCCLWMLLKN